MLFGGFTICPIAVDSPWLGSEAEPCMDKFELGTEQ